MDVLYKYNLLPAGGMIYSFTSTFDIAKLARVDGLTVELSGSSDDAKPAGPSVMVRAHSRWYGRRCICTVTLPHALTASGEVVLRQRFGERGNVGWHRKNKNRVSILGRNRK